MKPPLTAEQIMKGLKSGSLALYATPGEVFDRYTILLIKSVMVADEEKKEQAQNEALELCRYIYQDNSTVELPITELIQQLYDCNLKLWNIEDEIRAMDELIWGRKHWCGNCAGEGSRVDGEDAQKYCRLARSVYITNDERSRLKAAIDEDCGRKSEVKQYSEYSA